MQYTLNSRLASSKEDYVQNQQLKSLKFKKKCKKNCKKRKLK